MPDTILFLDIDGCLSRGKFARFDLAALQTLEQLVQQSPTEVVLCTGRSLSYIEALAQIIHLGRYAITDHGALLYDYLDDKTIPAPQMTPAVRLRIQEMAQYLAAHKNSLDVHWEMSHGKEACVSLVAEKGKTAEDVYAVVTAKLNTEGFDLHCSGRALDIAPHGVNKWTGVQHFLHHTGREAAPLRLAAIGDSQGDLPILTEVDFAACPANAADAVKAVCHYISPKADIHGVLDIYRHHIFPA